MSVALARHVAVLAPATSGVCSARDLAPVVDLVRPCTTGESLEGTPALGGTPTLEGTSTLDAEPRTRRLDRLARALVLGRERVALALARVARAVVDGRVWTVFGYARIEDYARERCGRSGRFLRDLAVLGRRLDDLSPLSAALTGLDGGAAIGRVAALAIARVATNESSAAWIAQARTLTVRGLLDAVRRSRNAGSSWPLEAAEQRAASDATIDDDDERVRVVLPVPPAVLAAFDETRRLADAVNGAESGAAELVEALVAEAASGPHPDGIDCSHLAPGRPRVELRQRSSRSPDDDTDAECGLDDDDDTAGAADLLERLNDLEQRAGAGGPACLDDQLRQLVMLEDEIERRLAALLLRMTIGARWSVLGYRDAADYAEERLGMARATTTERIRLARALRSLPLLRAAYERGEVCAASAVLVVRVLGEACTSEPVERAWVIRAREATVKRLRDEARAIALGRLAGDRDLATPPDVFHGSACEGSARQEDVAGVRADAPQPLDDAAWMTSLRTAPGDTARRVRELIVRGAVPPQREVALRLVLPHDLASGLLTAIEAARQRIEHQLVAEAGQPRAPRRFRLRIDSMPVEPAALTAARHIMAAGRPIPAWIGLAALLDEFVTTWDDPRSVPARPQNRTLVRDGWRCAAPGCTSRRNLEEHHVRYRSRGGDVRAASNLITTCAFHHRLGEHGDLASCLGRAPLDLHWGLGRADLRQWFRNERRIQAL